MIHTLKPPLGVRLNTSHPMANGLVGCWLLNERDGNKVYDLSGNGHHGIFANSPVWIPDGLEFEYNVTWDSRLVRCGDVGWFPAYEATVFMDVYPHTMAAASVAYWWTIDRGVSNSSPSISLGRHTSLGRASFNYNGTSEIYSGAYNFISDAWQRVAVRFRSGGSADIYVNGELFVNDASIGSYVLGIGQFSFGAYSRSSALAGYADDIDVRSVMVYDKFCSDYEIKALSIDPYAMFEPEPIYLFGSAGGGGGSALTKSLSDTISLSDSIKNKPGLNKADSISMSDTFINSFGLNKSDTVNLSDDISKSPGINKTDTINLSDSILKTPGLNKSDSVNLTDDIIKTSEINKADTINLTDSFSKVASFLRSFSDTINLSDTILKNIGLSLSDTINLSDNFNAIITLILSLNDTISMSDSISKEVDLSKEDAINLTDEIIKSFGLNETDTVNLSDIISKSIEINKSDTVNLSDNFSSLLALILAINDTINMSDAISKEIDLSKSDTINLTDDLSKLFGLTESDIINLADNFSTSSDIIYALLNFVAENRTFNFNAKTKTFNFNAKTRGTI